MLLESKKILITTVSSVTVWRITAEGSTTPLCSRCGLEVIADGGLADDGRGTGEDPNQDSEPGELQNLEEKK